MQKIYQFFDKLLKIIFNDADRKIIKGPAGFLFVVCMILLLVFGIALGERVAKAFL